jgi:hypothetical protein
MAKRTRKTLTGQQNFLKPTLIKCGKHLINPNDVSCISQVRVKEVDPGDDDPWPDDVRPTERSLYIVRMISNPNPEYPCWVEKKDIGVLLEQFNIVE